MKLSEIALPNLGKTQGSPVAMVEPNVMMSIKNICSRGGKNPNLFELISVCRLLQTLKDGSFYQQSNPFEVNMSTSKELLDLLRAMTPEQLCDTATKLLGLLELKDRDAFAGFANPTQEYASWIKWVHAREATD